MAVATRWRCSECSLVPVLVNLATASVRSLRCCVCVTNKQSRYAMRAGTLGGKYCRSWRKYSVSGVFDFNPKLAYTTFWCQLTRRGQPSSATKASPRGRFECFATCQLTSHAPFIFDPKAHVALDPIKHSRPVVAIIAIITIIVKAIGCLLSEALTYTVTISEIVDTNGRRITSGALITVYLRSSQMRP